MTTPNDILIRIATGRAQAARDAAATLDQTLATVADLVREMRPAEAPVTVERGNTADLADLEAMRDILDGADWPPTPFGLSEALNRADEADELDRRHAEALATISDLRAQVAALTPGPWVRLGDTAPNLGETVLVSSGKGNGVPWMHHIRETAFSRVHADYLWRRLPAGLLDVPAPTVAP